MKYFIIADTHFAHDKIIGYCSRPFKSSFEMDETLIKNWNKVVSNNDIIIHLGDFCLGSKSYCRQIVKRLNGRKILIKGNHDQWSDQFYRDCGFEFVSKFPIVYDNFYLMSHAPLQLSETTPFFNYYGHVHNDNKYQDNETSKCVSVERIDYKPYLFMEKD